MRTKSRPVVQKPPANFHEVRRRFIRQNRELAKNNSSQSLRIRSLELDISRLSADNLELRNQVLRLENEVSTVQRKAGGQVQADLRQKIQEMLGIVDCMQDDEAQDAALQPTTKKPLEGNWRERQTLSESMRENQMPTIQEDKQYPRRTLDAGEIQAIRLSDHSSNESPDLGPPPVARFDYEGDPVKQASPLGNKVSLSPVIPPAEEEDDLPATLSVNLETRRKRKDGQPKLEIRRRSVLPPQSPQKIGDEGSTILRTGAKRKLADRETEKPIRPPSKGDFTFSRKSNGEDASGSETVAEQARQPDARPKDKPARKVLAEKSSNMSPRKAPPATALDKPDNDTSKPAVKRSVTVGKDAEPKITIRRRSSAIPLPSPQEEVRIIDSVELPPPSESVLPITEPQPKTPAALDLFSPTPSEPSARPDTQGRGDTPPPGDLSTMSIATDGGTRPSRRARAAVNYAEPSLNAKMRRPGKKMADAISGLQPHRRSMSSSALKEFGSVASIIKDEPLDDEEAKWKDLPDACGSPLVSKGEIAGEHPAAHLLSETEDPSRKVTVPVTSSRKRRQPSQPAEAPDLNSALKKLEELDIYDFKDSSSPATDCSVNSREASRTDNAERSHRRRSSALKVTGAQGGFGGGRDLGLAAEPSSSSRLGSSRVASRRKSMML